MATILRQRTSIQIGVVPAALMTTYWDSTGAAIGLLATEAVARVRAFFAAQPNIWPPGMGVTPNLVLDEIEETTGQIVNQVSASDAAPTTFTGTSDLLPTQTQALIRLSTNTFVEGRKLQGRINVPYMKESANDVDGLPSTATVVSLGTCASKLGTVVTTAMSQRVWSRPQPGRPGLSAPVIARSVPRQWAVLKSRR